MVLSRDRWQHPFIHASFEGSTGVLVQVSTKAFSSHLAPPPKRASPGQSLLWRVERPVRGSSLLWLPCLALLAMVSHPRVPCFAQERLRGGTESGKREARKGRGDNPRMLTSKIKKAETAADLLGVLDAAVDSPIFNEFHASATCTKLAAFHGKGKLATNGALCFRGWPSAYMS